ncbi:shikimate kinase [Lysobacter hankyongensis]|uniref:Shikimate kinase n=1 Tax=Lysobacter hankyongensis TaxID=1176535 RepID=A0ABP9BCG4_9GAMM
MESAPHLVLVGPMGAGKSSIGRRLARTCGLPFVDLDREIETRAGTDIPMIFAHEGEAGFRRRERETLADLLEGAPCVLATGGGAVLDPDNRARMRRRGFVVYLCIDVDTQLARLANDRSRPLIVADDREAVLRRLAAERGPLYDAVADLTFPPTDPGPAEATSRLAAMLADRWPRTVAPAPAPDPT